MSIANNSIFYTLNLLRESILSEVLLPHTHNNNKGSRRKHWEVMDMLMTLIMVMVSGVYTYPKTHQTVYIK